MNKQKYIILITFVTIFLILPSISDNSFVNAEVVNDFPNGYAVGNIYLIKDDVYSTSYYSYKFEIPEYSGFVDHVSFWLYQSDYDLNGATYSITCRLMPMNSSATIDQNDILTSVTRIEFSFLQNVSSLSEIEIIVQASLINDNEFPLYVYISSGLLTAYHEYTELNLDSQYNENGGDFTSISYVPIFAVWDTFETPESTPTPAPTATPTATPPTLEGPINSILEFFFGPNMNSLGLGVALAIFAGLSLLGAKYAGSWGFLGGLTVAAILCFVFEIIGLWAVVLIGIVDAVALVRGMSSSGKATSKGTE